MTSKKQALQNLACRAAAITGEIFEVLIERERLGPETFLKFPLPNSSGMFKTGGLRSVAQRLLSDPQAVIASGSNERPFLADFSRWCSGHSNDG